jgi:hypothetical protein
VIRSRFRLRRSRGEEGGGRVALGLMRVGVGNAGCRQYGKQNEFHAITWVYMDHDKDAFLGARG